jgi:peptide/nickel transport system substrate-binding protein
MSKLTRRSFLQLAPTIVGAAAVPTAFFDSVVSAAPAGRPVPEILFSHQTTGGEPEMARHVSEDLEKLGLRVKLRPLSLQAWLDALTQRTYGDVTNRVKTPLPPRIADPESLLFETYHSSQAQSPRYNFGNYRQPEFDKWYELQAKEFDPKKRLDYIGKACNIMAADYFDCFRANGPSVLHVYNKDWTGGIGTAGYGLAGTAFNWTWPLIKAESGKRRVVVAQPSLRAHTNPFAPDGWSYEGQYVFDRLATLDQNLKIIPWAVESFASKDSVTWDLVLRRGMKWHDGRPVTVEDLRWTFDFILTHRPSYFAQVWDNVASVTIADAGRQTVRVVCKQPYASFPAAVLVFTSLYPKHVIEAMMREQGVAKPHELRFDAKQVVGSGFFKLKRSTRDVETVFEANKEHWFAPKGVDELVWKVVRTTDAMMGQLQNREIDFAYVSFTPSQVKELLKSPHLAVKEHATTAAPYYTFRVDQLPWRDIEFRKAFHWSIDRNYQVQVMWEGAGRVVTEDSVFVPSHPFHTPVETKHGYDLQRARQILKDAGYTWDGSGGLVFPAEGDQKFKKRVNDVVVQYPGQKNLYEPVA